MQLQDVLDAAVPGKILLPETPAYEESNSSYFACFESEVKPALIVQPTSVAEVGAILKALSPSLVKQEVHLAIRGTGHTPFAGTMVPWSGYRCVESKTAGSSVLRTAYLKVP
jgi:hypothetical protein